VHSIEALLVSQAELSGSFGDVEHDRCTGAVELVAEVCATRRHQGLDGVEQLQQV
jgi:hypothetical protein